ncbi:putative reverse transcriptase domain-containing protein [Tanacetum coccineum]|uniref:Reverse transcriptase domain-containing protein n=1 Tax=Tanacetum coccineum TaxID=301880 RepID=A0ABQ4WSZ2_9ASTR
MATYGSCSHGGRSSLRYSFEPHIRWRFVSSSPTQVESTLAMRSGQTVTIVGQQQQLLHLSKLTLRGNDARTFELVQRFELELELETRQKEGLENGVGTIKLTGLDHLANIRKEKFTFSMPTFAGKHPSLTIQLLFVDEALEIPYSYWDGAGHRQVMRGAYGCILAQPRFLFLRQMVNTRESTPKFLGAAFDEAVQRAVNALLPGLTTQITNELCQNGAGGSGEQPPTIHTCCSRFWGCADEFKARLASYKLEAGALSWWKAVKQAKGGETYVATLPWKDFRELFFLQYFPRSEQQKYEREYHTILQRDGEPSGEFMKRFLRLAGFLGKKAGTQEEQAKNFKWALCDWILDGIVNTEFTDVAQVANAARNIEILCERSSQNNKRNRDGDRIRPMTQGNNQRGYDQKMYDGRRCNSDQKSRHNRGQQYNRSSGPSGQKVYPDYASSPPCDICGKLHPGKACYRVTGACFIYGLTGHMARDCPKNGGNGGRGYGNDNQPAAKGRVFSSTKDQATNSSGLVVINHEYQNCPLRVDDKIRFANLFPMDMNDFDVILGMNSGVEGVILCLRVLSLRCLLVKLLCLLKSLPELFVSSYGGTMTVSLMHQWHDIIRGGVIGLWRSLLYGAYGCILGSLRRLAQPTFSYSCCGQAAQSEKLDLIVDS